MGLMETLGDVEPVKKYAVYSEREGQNRYRNCVCWL
jgi:hypothetical protein